MKNMFIQMTRTLCCVLFVLLLSAVGVTKSYAYDFSAVCETGQTLYYNITDATNHYVALTCPSNNWSGYTKPAGDIILPETVEYEGITYTITSIGENAFRYCDELTGHLTIPNSVIYIYKRAFQYCSNITELTIGEGVTYIWDYAFWYCSQLQTVHFNSINCTSMYTDTSGSGGYSNEYYYSIFGKESTPIVNLTIGPKVTRIPNYAFKNCTNACGELVLPSSLSYIGSNTFSNCRFSSIVSFRKTPPSTSSDAFYRMNYGIPVIVPEGSVSNYQGASGWNNFTNYQSFPSIIASICSTGQTLYFRIDSDNRALLSYPGNSTSNPWPETYEKPTGFVVIPDTVECANYPGASSSVTLSVIGIDPYALNSCDGLTQVTIPEGIITVGDYAFCNCPALETVYFNAINCTYMQSSGGHSVFSSNLTRVVIGNAVQRIPAYAFYGSVDLYQRLVIPASVTEIGSEAFNGCNSLVQMIIQGNGLLTIGNGAFYGCSALRNALVLPNSVISVGSYAFYGCSMLPSVTIGTSTTTIGDHAFWNCSALTTVNFNATNCISMNTDSEYSVFGSTTPITTLNIGENVTRIPDYAFRNSPDINGGLVFPSALTSIGQYAFSSCSGYSGDLVIPNLVNSIGQSAFEDCNGFNGSLTLPNNDLFLAINNNTFSGCSGLMGSLVIPNSVTSIGSSAFKNCSGFSESLVISNSATSIGSSAFWNCSGLLGILEIPNAVLTIGEYAFYGCSNISELSIGEGVTTIDNYAFCNCPLLTTVHFNATNCTQMHTMVGTNSSNYQYYSVFDGSIVNLSIGENVTNIPDYAFKNETITNAITIPDATTYIGKYAFYGAQNSELTIGEGVTTIGSYAFWNSPNLATVHFNAMNCTQMSTVYSGNYYSVFSSNNAAGNPAIATLTIGESVTTIPEYAFRNCSNLTNNLVIPNSVNSIGQYAFCDCIGQSRTLILGSSVSTIGQYAFNGCSGFIGDLVIPNSVNTMGKYAFYGCSGFDGSLIIGSGVQTIDQYTFAGCSGFLGSLIVGRQVNSVYNYAFQNCSGFTTLISENPTPPSAVNNSFQGMTFTIPLYVPYGMMPAYQNAVGWRQFTNRVEQCVFDQLDNDLWSDEWNWYAFELPGPNDVVCVNSNCHLDMDADVLHLYVYNLNDVLTINSDMTLTTTYGVGTVQSSQLVITDGGQLVNPFSNAYGTVQKHVTGYGDTEDGWYTVASPICGGVAIGELATGNYDLYTYNESSAMWLNQKVEGNFTQLNPAQGYLYANQATKTLNFAGQLNASNAEVSVPVTCLNGNLTGFNLVGNPYTNNISITDVRINDTPQTAFYRVEGGNNLVAYVAEDNEPIKVGEGFFVKTTESNALTFGSACIRGDNQLDSYVCLVLSKNGLSTGSGTVVVDRAYLRMNEGETLEKFSTSTAHSQLYFINGNKRYAIAINETGDGIMPLYLENANGTYTLEFIRLNIECGYLHLIDNLTGTDIDLLETSTYTFEAKPSDFASRFKLVFQ